MLTHTNAFASKRYTDRRRHMDDFSGEYFSIELEIALSPGAFAMTDLAEFEDRIFNLIFCVNSYGCICPDKTAYFHLKISSKKGGILFETMRDRYDEPYNLDWDDRMVWLTKEDEYQIHLEMDERAGKTIAFYKWLEQSTASYWNTVGIKGFMHCESDPHVAACFRKGGGHRPVFVNTLDIPENSQEWREGTVDTESMTGDWFAMSIHANNPYLWERIYPEALQIAALNQVDLNPNLSLFEKLTDARSRDEAELYIEEHAISFYPCFEISGGNKYLFEDSIRRLLKCLAESDEDDYKAETQTAYFYNRDSLCLEIWDINPETFDLMIWHTPPLR
jgi:hypothetical protein